MPTDLAKLCHNLWHKLLLELGNGFTFVGRGYRLEVGKTEQENPTIGLIICKEKDEVIAQYAVESAGEPIGISEYELPKVYTEDLKSSLPTIVEIEQQLRN